MSGLNSAAEITCGQGNDVVSQKATTSGAPVYFDGHLYVDVDEELLERINRRLRGDD